MPHSSQHWIRASEASKACQVKSENRSQLKCLFWPVGLPPTATSRLQLAIFSGSRINSALLPLDWNPCVQCFEGIQDLPTDGSTGYSSARGLPTLNWHLSRFLQNLCPSWWILSPLCEPPQPVRPELDDQTQLTHGWGSCAAPARTECHSVYCYQFNIFLVHKDIPYRVSCHISEKLRQVGTLVVSVPWTKRKCHCCYFFFIQYS